MLSDRDKEQTLVAAAYRAAANKCNEIEERYKQQDGGKWPELCTAAPEAPSDCAISISKLTPTDADNHLRALMMEVAWAVLGSCILEGTENFKGAEKIVDEVLYGK